jgi:hypothetical protein
MKLQTMIFTDQKAEPIDLAEDALNKLKANPNHFIMVEDKSGQKHVVRNVETKKGK